VFSQTLKTLNRQPRKSSRLDSTGKDVMFLTPSGNIAEIGRIDGESSVELPSVGTEVQLSINAHQPGA
jgi:hypothetical protein